MTDEAKRGGLLVRAGEALRFLPSSVAVRVVAVPPITAVPGSMPELLGVALHEGVVLPVIRVGERRDAMIVCQVAGELLGLVGLDVVGTGEFQPDADGVRTESGERVEPFDFASVFARVEQRERRGGITGP